MARAAIKLGRPRGDVGGISNKMNRLNRVKEITERHLAETKKDVMEGDIARWTIEWDELQENICLATPELVTLDEGQMNKYLKKTKAPLL